MQKKMSTIEVNPRIIFAEDDASSEQSMSADEDVEFAANVPARGDSKRWRIVHQAEHLTGFKSCAACEEPLTFPARLTDFAPIWGPYAPNATGCSSSGGTDPQAC